MPSGRLVADSKSHSVRRFWAQPKPTVIAERLHLSLESRIPHIEMRDHHTLFDLPLEPDVGRWAVLSCVICLQACLSPVAMSDGGASSADGGASVLARIDHHPGEKTTECFSVFERF